MKEFLEQVADQLRLENRLIGDPLEINGEGDPKIVFIPFIFCNECFVISLTEMAAEEKELYELEAGYSFPDDSYSISFGQARWIEHFEEPEQFYCREQTGLEFSEPPNVFRLTKLLCKLVDKHLKHYPVSGYFFIAADAKLEKLYDRFTDRHAAKRGFTRIPQSKEGEWYGYTNNAYRREQERSESANEADEGRAYAESCREVS